MARTLVGQTKDTRRNYLINGDMAIAQRGTTFSSIANATYCLDRWRYDKAGGVVVHTITQDTDVPTLAQAGVAFQSSLRLNLVTPDTSIAPGDYATIQQRVEGYNWAFLAQNAFTLSFWVKATLAGTYCVSFQNGVDRTYVAEYTIAASGVWQYVSIAVPASPSGGTWNYGVGTGLRVNWTLASGSTFQTTGGSWNSVDAIATANQVNGINTGATDFRITGCMLNIGSAPSPFSLHASHKEGEFAACLRYHETFGFSGSASRPICMGVVSVANTTGIIVIPFAVKKRANVVPTFSAAGHFQIANASINTAVTNLTDKGCGVDAGWLDITFSATIAGNSGFAMFVNNTAGRLDFDCEL